MDKSIYNTASDLKLHSTTDHFDSLLFFPFSDTLFNPVRVENIMPCKNIEAYGTAKSGVGIASMGVMKPDLVMRNIIPVIMAGVLGIYGQIVAVILNGTSKYLWRYIDRSLF